MSQTQTPAEWINAVNNADVQAGDEITLQTESEIEQFDGEATVTAAGVTDDSWIEVENPGESVVWVVPDADAEGGAALIQAQALRATGHFAGRRDLATVYGIEQAD